MAINLSDITALAEIAKERPPVCDCGNCYAVFDNEHEELERVTYQCAGCKRNVPLCFGGDGKFSDGSSSYDYCDDCFVAIEQFICDAIDLRSNGAIASVKVSEG